MYTLGQSLKWLGFTSQAIFNMPGRLATHCLEGEVFLRLVDGSV